MFFSLVASRLPGIWGPVSFITTCFIVIEHVWVVTFLSDLQKHAPWLVSLAHALELSFSTHHYRVLMVYLQVFLGVFFKNSIERNSESVDGVRSNRVIKVARQDLTKRMIQ